MQKQFIIVSLISNVFLCLITINVVTRIIERNRKMRKLSYAITSLAVENKILKEEMSKRG